uniref:Uncharacterized protein n=1 Tax=Glossina brevipalpis TaxID=37001 RepID=A0A1A9WEM9_9MUSC
MLTYRKRFWYIMIEVGLKFKNHQAAIVSLLSDFHGAFNEINYGSMILLGPVQYKFCYVGGPEANKQCPGCICPTHGNFDFLQFLTCVIVVAFYATCFALRAEFILSGA